MDSAKPFGDKKKVPFPNSSGTCLISFHIVGGKFREVNGPNPFSFTSSEDLDRRMEKKIVEDLRSDKSNASSNPSDTTLLSSMAQRMTYLEQQLKNFKDMLQKKVKLFIYSEY
jgi:hypothetical protein